MPRGNIQARGWCWTLNNYTAEDEKFFQELEEVKRIIYGRETCPTTGTPHLQGFVMFDKPKRWSWVTALLDGRCHWEKAKNLAGAWKYCKKEGDFWEKDTGPGQGARSDWENIREMIREGADDLDLLMANPSIFARCGNGIERIRSVLAEKRTRMTKCTWYYGESGTGKSTYALKKYPEADWITITRSGFIQGYTGAPIVIMDDPDLVALQREMFLNMVNHTPWVCNIKGGQRTWNVKKLIICSNTDPRAFHAADAAVQRRIKPVHFSLSATGDFIRARA